MTMTEVLIHNRLEDVLHQVPRGEEEKMIETMKQNNFVDKLAGDLSSTIYGRMKDYSVHACRLIVSSFSPRIPISDPNTKMTRWVRGVESHLICGEPSTAKSSWFNVIRNQGINVVFTQLATPGGLTGTPFDEGLVGSLKETCWLVPEAETILSSPKLINILRSLIEDQTISKISAMTISRQKDIDIKSSVLLSLVLLPKASHEYQLLSRLFRVDFEYYNWDEVKSIGHNLTESLMIDSKAEDNFSIEPKHFFAMLCSKARDVKHCYFTQDMKREIENSWCNLIGKYYESKNIPKGLSLRDLVDGFRCAQNTGLLNFFQRDVKDNVLQLVEEDKEKGIGFMEEVMKSRSNYSDEEMKETGTAVRLSPATIVQVFQLVSSGVSYRDVEEKLGVSISTISRIVKEFRRGGVFGD